MRSVIFYLTAAVSLFLLTTILSAQAPPEQLQQMVATLQKAPADNALREKIIKFAATVRPPLPEEAERRLARGKAAYKGANSIAEYQNAIKEYQAAVGAAPWWGDAYFNLGFVQDKAEKYADALQSLKWALMASPDDKEIKALIYEVEYRSEQANSPEARVAAEQQAAVAAAKRIEGDWYQDVSSHDMSRSGVRYLETLSIKCNSAGVWQVQFLFTGNSVVQADYHPYDVRLVGTELRFKIDSTFNDGGRIEVVATNEITPTASADGNTLRLSYNPMPFTAAQQAHWAGWSKYVPKPHVDEFRRQ